ncbi:MAG TPA: ATP-dependent Clp protease proteolytic subunit [Acidimicrobiales bacterium]|nr:ATP-dependent Clp protease proteolytic subunit [Acidimicrobiales bacterium]
MAAQTPFGDQVLSSLFARRIVFVHGELTSDKASETAAALLTLDALGDEHVELRLQAATGAWEAAGVLIDVIDVLGVPVHTVALGLVGGGVVGVLAAGSHRSISPHARLHLRHPDTSASGRPGDISRSIEAQTSLQAEFLRLLAERTGRPLLEIEQEWGHGRYLDAPSALALGYVDALAA